MLQPIYELIFEEYDTEGRTYRNENRLALPNDQVVISYKTYNSNSPADMQAIIDKKLTPGKPLDQTIEAQNLF